MPDLDHDRLVEQIYDALDRGDPAGALEMAERHLEGETEEDPVLRFLAGVALLDADHPGEAATHLARAVELDAEDAEFRATLALALFRACRFEEAAEHARSALELDTTLPDAHAVRAVLLERKGLTDEADRHFLEATRLDAERYPDPVRLDRKNFETEIANAEELLPEPFREKLADVVITVEPLPSDEILLDETPPLDPELLGLFVGVPLTEQGHMRPDGGLPPRIFLFQRNLERFATDSGGLREEIAVTLYHELGHYLGLDEEELIDLDLG